MRTEDISKQNVGMNIKRNYIPIWVWEKRCS